MGIVLGILPVCPAPYSAARVAPCLACQGFPHGGRFLRRRGIAAQPDHQKLCAYINYPQQLPPAIRADQDRSKTIHTAHQLKRTQTPVKTASGLDDEHTVLHLQRRADRRMCTSIKNGQERLGTTTCILRRMDLDNPWRGKLTGDKQTISITVYPRR